MLLSIGCYGRGGVVGRGEEGVVGGPGFGRGSRNGWGWSKGVGGVGWMGSDGGQMRCDGGQMESDGVEWGLDVGRMGVG